MLTREGRRIHDLQHLSDVARSYQSMAYYIVAHTEGVHSLIDRAMYRAIICFPTFYLWRVYAAVVIQSYNTSISITIQSNFSYTKIPMSSITQVK